MTITQAELKEGNSWSFAPIVLSKADIIRFAAYNDPQPIHLEENAAKASIFGGLVAPGLQPYIAWHTRDWVKAVQGHFICGFGLDKVRFFKPVRPEMPLLPVLHIEAVEPEPAHRRQRVTWRVSFLDTSNRQVGFVVFLTYHQRSPH